MTDRGKMDSGTSKSGYVYIKGDKDHVDLEDLFQGKYIKNRGIWQFDKEREAEVLRFLDVSSSSSSDEELVQMPSRNRQDRLHRANSFNASDESNEDCDSIDDTFRRKRVKKDTAIQNSLKLKQEAEKHDEET